MNLDIKRISFTSNQLKWLALVFMTIDHLAAIAEEIPTTAPYVSILRTLGRIAAPLFLFVLTDSIRKTKNKPKFILRLYIAGVGCGIFTILTNLISWKIAKTAYTPGNIIFTYFYVSVYIFLIENAVQAVKERKIKRVIALAAGFISTIVPELLYQWFDSIKVTAEEISKKIFLGDVLTSILSPILNVEYSLLFVFMGVLLYFAKERKRQCVVFLCFCAASFWGTVVERNLWPFNDFFSGRQFWMVLALPFMMLYNGEQGKPHKAFFYVYYPIHRYLIFLLSKLIAWNP